MLHACYRTTAAAPLLGPALRVIRATPLAHLLIGYRAPRVDCERLRRTPDAGKCACECAGGAGRRPLGEALLLERLLVGGNQNEALPLANRRILADALCDRMGPGCLLDVLI